MVYLHEGKTAGIAGDLRRMLNEDFHYRLAMRLYSGTIWQSGTEEKVTVQKEAERPAIKFGNGIFGADGGNSAIPCRLSSNDCKGDMTRSEEDSMLFSTLICILLNTTLSLSLAGKTAMFSRMRLMYLPIL